jgi:hypothetical protein
MKDHDGIILFSLYLIPNDRWNVSLLLTSCSSKGECNRTKTFVK